jgi:hypothetical protein
MFVMLPSDISASRSLHCNGVTPNAPSGLFYNIENEPDDTCLYKRLKMDYDYGIGKYTQEEIDKASQSPGFESGSFTIWVAP